MSVKRILVPLLALLFLCGYASLSAQVVPSPTWTDFGGSACTINGVLIPIGTVIDAYDSTGVHCGHQVATSPGLYPYMPVYGDDPYTAGDEGADHVGEHITFRMNGSTAYRLGPGSDAWVGGIAVQKIMNLALSDITLFSVQVTTPVDNSGLAGTDVSYQVTVKNNGNGVDLIKLTGSSSSGWAVSGLAPSGDYFTAGQSKVYTVKISIPANATFGHQDILTLNGASIFNPATSDSKNITTTVDQATGIDGTESTIPGAFSLGQNFPNPFNPETSIKVNLEKTGNVDLVVYDIIGRKVATIYSGVLAAGAHEFRWAGKSDNGQNVASGIYFYRLSNEQLSITRKMALLK
jgi:hypothetical protein